MKEPLKQMDNPWCCQKMGHNVKDEIIFYDCVDRTYGIFFKPKRFNPFNYCPWCGKRLPLRLTEAFHICLKREHNIDYGHFPGFMNVPEEFRSDAWWKKRGL